MEEAEETVDVYGSTEARLSDIAKLRSREPAAAEPWMHRFVHDSEASALIREASNCLSGDWIEKLVAFYELAVLRANREMRQADEVSGTVEVKRHDCTHDSLLVEMWRFEAMLYDPPYLPVVATRMEPLAKTLEEGDLVRVQFAFAVGGRAVDEIVAELTSRKSGMWLGRVLTEPEALAGLLAFGETVAFPESAVSEVAVSNARTRAWRESMLSS